MNPDLRNKALRRRLAVALSFALALPAALPLGSATASHFSDTEELTAEDNVGAAIAFSASTFPEGADEAVLGRDDAFADSLASGMLQASRPLLLTASAELSEPTKNELARLQVSTVHVLGGDQAITPAVVTALETEGYTVERHSGPTRIDTAVAVARDLAPAATKAILARAFGTEEDETRAFADSLAAGGWAAAAEMPVLLTESEKLSEATGAYLKTSAIKEVSVVGGEGAVSETVVTQLTALGITVKRVSGPTRFHTALAIAAERGFATAADAPKVIVAEGQAAQAWAPGFAAAARSKKDNAPIVLAVGTEVPEPTTQFLSGGGGTEPDPSESPTPDPSESPTPDPSESPTPDPSESPSEEPSGGKAALLCAPMLATEACDAAATALGQVAGAGEQLITFALTAVSRYDHAVGVVATPEAVNSLSVTGCGYTDEPVYVETDGTVYLMLAGDPGTCSAEFSFATSAGTRTQAVEFTVGENFAPSSVLPVPELVAVRPVKADDEGVYLRFVFDEPVAPSPEINPTMFGIVRYDNKDTETTQLEPSSIQRDPRNPSAVLAVFNSLHYAASTTAYVQGGRPSDTGDPTGNKALAGAVRDLSGYANPTAHAPVRTYDASSSNSPLPDLLSVGDYEAATQSVLFTFSEPVALVLTSPPVGAATLVLADGTIKKSDEGGWTAGADGNTMRVSFAGDGLSATDSGQIRRGYADQGVVVDTDSSDEGAAGADQNTPVAVVVTGGGITPLPDFVQVQNPSVTVSGTNATLKVDYVFEDAIVKPLESPTDKFAVVTRTGAVYVSDTGTAVKDDQAQKTVTAVFTTGLPTTFKTSDILYYTVLTGAVRGFDTQKSNFADTIRVDGVEVYQPGFTRAPDLNAVDDKYTPKTCSLTTVGGQGGVYALELEFDEAVTRFARQSAPGSTPPATPVQPAEKILVWHMGNLDDTGTSPDKPFVVEMWGYTTGNSATNWKHYGQSDPQDPSFPIGTKTHVPYLLKGDPESSPETLTLGNKKVVLPPGYMQADRAGRIEHWTDSSGRAKCDEADGTEKADPTNGKKNYHFWLQALPDNRIKYISVEHDVFRESDTTVRLYPSGRPIKN